MLIRTAAPVLEALLRNYRGTWRASVFSQFFAPLLYLASLGFGLGALVDGGARGGVGGVGGAGGVPYATFVASGLLAATAMQSAISESTYPVLGSVIWQRGYHAMIATPLRVVDVLAGHLAHIALQLLLGTTAFALVATALGVVRSPWLVVAVPVAVLCGLAHAAPVMAFAVRQEDDQGFAVIFRLVLVPVFLFAGTFFPVDQLPAVVRPVAWVTPLWHGTEAVRALVLGGRGGWAVLGHVAYLALWAGVGSAVALRQYRRRLRP